MGVVWLRVTNIKPVQAKSEVTQSDTEALIPTALKVEIKLNFDDRWMVPQMVLRRGTNIPNETRGHNVSHVIESQFGKRHEEKQSYFSNRRHRFFRA
jgi:hypothetical protein